MRGALRPARQGGEIRGIIPADAGSTYVVNQSQDNTKDHPRGCGEHSVLDLPCVHDAGSSPRMRGALMETRHSVIEGRIIPADAGSTGRKEAGDRTMLDHPRGCGEHYGQLSQCWCLMGSSPRMRGARSPSLLIHLARRIIPADAGSTQF